MRFRIESRESEGSQWRTVRPRPHDEQYPFDSHGLVFESREDAEAAARSMRRWNVGEFRVYERAIE